MTKTDSKQVGDHNYVVNQWPATTAMVMKLKVAKYLGKALTSFTEDGKDFQAKAMKALLITVETVNPEEFISFLKDIVCAAVRDGEKMNKARFDEYFQDDFMEAYEVAVFVMKVNYEDFLGSVRKLLSGV